MDPLLASATAQEASAFTSAFTAFLQSYRGAVDPQPVDDLPVHVDKPNIPASARIPSNQELEDAGISTRTDPEVDDELARPGHVRNMAKSAPTASSSKASGSMRAPPVPVDPKIGTRLTARVQQIVDEDPESAKAKWDEMNQRLDELAYIVNPYVARNRQYMLNAHSTFLKAFEPQLTEEAHWHTDVVIQFAVNTLIQRITTSRGRDGGPIQSRTAIDWLGHHLANLCMYTNDPVTGARTGLTVLRRGMYQRLENAVKWAVIEYSLVRHSKIQQRLDRHALQLIYEVMLKHTEEHGRAVAFQTMTAANFALSGALRPGSLQANHPEYVKRKMYMKVGDCEISVIRKLCWSVKVTVEHWKGHSGATGERKVLTFGPVTKAHNLIFEPALSLILDILARGGFEGITTPDELFACELAVLPLKDSFKQNPLFLMCLPRGLGLIEGTPAPVHALSSRINHYGFVAGVNDASIYGIRRYSGNKFSLSLGRDLTLYLLNHRDRPGVTMDNHYTTGLEDYPITELVLGELEGKLTDTEKRALAKNKRSSVAMNFLIKRVQATDPDLDACTNEDVIKRKYGLDEDEEAIKDDEAVINVENNCRETWNHVMDLVPGKRIPWGPGVGKRLRGVLAKVAPKDKAIAESRINTFRRIQKRRLEVRRAALRKVRRQRKKSKVREKPVATYRERDAAEKLLDEESPWFGEVREILETGVKRFLHENKNPASKARITKEEADAADEPQEVQDEFAKLQVEEPTEEEPDDDDEGEDDITEGNEPLPGNKISPPQEVPIDPKGKAKTSPIEVNLRRQGLRAAVNVEELEDESTELFDDSAEPDALGVDTDAARGVLFRILYDAHERQKAKKLTWTSGAKKSKGKQKASDEPVERVEGGRILCTLCAIFTSRAHLDHTFATVSIFERHKREKHDAWSNLELEMETSDPKKFKCPGCDKPFNSLVSCKIHCWRDCENKDEYYPLYEAHEAQRGTRQKNIADQDNERKEARKVGQEMRDPGYGVELSQLVHRFTDNPEALQGWADRQNDQAPKLTRGLTLDEVQQPCRQLAGLAAGEPYEGVGEQFVGDYTQANLPSASGGNVIALDPSFTFQRKERIANAINAEMEQESEASDFDEDDDEDSEQGSAGEHEESDDNV